jgi:ATP-binding cassette subfamily C (CFTR/MRP) protein 4
MATKTIVIYSRSRPLVPSLRALRKPPTNAAIKSDESTPLLVGSPNPHDEQRSSGDITLGLYWRYMSAGSSWFGMTNLLLSNILVQILFSGSDYYLQYWTRSEEKRVPDSDVNVTNETFTEEEIAAFDRTRDTEIWIYSGIITGLFVVSLVRTAGFLTMCLNSSVTLHRMLFNGVLRAPIRFFEINPLGNLFHLISLPGGIIT